MADRIDANLSLLAHAETWDNGKPIRESMFTDLPLAVDHLRYFAGCIRAQEGTISEIDDDTVAYHFQEPLGVTAWSGRCWPHCSGRVSLEAEILILRHQLNIQRRHQPKRLAFNADLRWAGSFSTEYHQGADDCEAGYRDPLASCRFQIVLAPEIAAPLQPRVAGGQTKRSDLGF